jgi:hypothetical protein
MLETTKVQMEATELIFPNSAEMDVLMPAVLDKACKACR